MDTLSFLFFSDDAPSVSSSSYMCICVTGLSVELKFYSLGLASGLWWNCLCCLWCGYILSVSCVCLARQTVQLLCEVSASCMDCQSLWSLLCVALCLTGLTSDLWQTGCHIVTHQIYFLGFMCMDRSVLFVSCLYAGERSPELSHQNPGLDSRSWWERPWQYFQSIEFTSV